MIPESVPTTKISVPARIAVALPAWVLMLGGALSGLLIRGVIQAMRDVETAGLGAVGFLDDYLKIRRQRSLGLNKTTKVIGQAVVAVGFGLLVAKLGHVHTELSFIRPSRVALHVLFYAWVPFVSLPIFAVLENMDHRLIEAATDLGANRFITFWRVTFPLSLPGVIAAFVFVLIPTTGEFIAPLYVGGPGNQLFGNEIQAFFGDSPNWNYGAVLAIGLIGIVLVLMLVFGRFLDTDLRNPAVR